MQVSPAEDARTTTMAPTHPRPSTTASGPGFHHQPFPRARTGSRSRVLVSCHPFAGSPSSGVRVRAPRRRLRCTCRIRDGMTGPALCWPSAVPLVIPLALVPLVVTPAVCRSAARAPTICRRRRLRPAGCRAAASLNVRDGVRGAVQVSSAQHSSGVSGHPSEQRRAQPHPQSARRCYGRRRGHGHGHGPPQPVRACSPPVKPPS